MHYLGTLAGSIVSCRGSLKMAWMGPGAMIMIVRSRRFSHVSVKRSIGVQDNWAWRIGKAMMFGFRASPREGKGWVGCHGQTPEVAIVILNPLLPPFRCCLWRDCGRPLLGH